MYNLFILSWVIGFLLIEYAIKEEIEYAITEEKQTFIYHIKDMKPVETKKTMEKFKNV
jgi:hypothetical protein